VTTRGTVQEGYAGCHAGGFEPLDDQECTVERPSMRAQSNHARTLATSSLIGAAGRATNDRMDQPRPADAAASQAADLLQRLDLKP
jgi:hypothetical protein